MHTRIVLDPQLLGLLQLRRNTNIKLPKLTNITQILRTIPLVTFTIVSILPTNALAHELSLPTSSAQSFRATQHGTSIRVAAVVAPHQPPLKRIQPPQLPVAATKPVLKPEPVIAKARPAQGAPLVLEGEASYYSRAGCLGCSPAMIMANGQPLDDNALTMAIGADKKHLVGYKAKVTSLATGKSVVVTITDTGGFYQAKYGHRVADLTVATKQAIGMAGGVGQVRVEVF